MGKKLIRVPAPVERALDAALDKALAIQRPVVLGYLDRVRAKRPDATPDRVIAQLERRYLTAVVGIGGASGAAAAIPGVGTGAAVATGAAEIAGFVSATAMYVLAVAEVHGVPVSDPEVRRALVLAVLLGEGATAALEGAAGHVPHWAQVIGRTTSREKIAGVNSRLAHLLLTRFGARQGALLVGRALPLGIGAGIGAAGNAALARAAIASARRAFGPAPDRLAPRVIDVGPEETRRHRAK
ncbi:MAG: hypothetical protein DLM57_04145 [Pseudonocardiales bacterium]|nr:MAG: hypothetical protein DLM57_04145 [Pseudonocardiales bacterium]